MLTDKSGCHSNQSSKINTLRNGLLTSPAPERKAGRMRVAQGRRILVSDYVCMVGGDQQVLNKRQNLHIAPLAHAQIGKNP